MPSLFFLVNFGENTEKGADNYARIAYNILVRQRGNLLRKEVRKWKK